MGPARQFSDEKLTLEIENHATIRMVRAVLLEWMKTQKLGDDLINIMNRSVFADTKRILREEEQVEDNAEYVEYLSLRYA